MEYNEIRKANRRMANLLKNNFLTNEFNIVQDTLKDTGIKKSFSDNIYKFTKKNVESNDNLKSLVKLINNGDTIPEIKRILKKENISFEEYQNKRQYLLDIRQIPSPKLLKIIDSFYSDPNRPDWSWDNLTRWAKDNDLISGEYTNIKANNLTDKEWADFQKKLGTLKSTGEFF